MTLWMSFNVLYQTPERELQSIGFSRQRRKHVISTDKGFEDFVIFSLEILESGFCRRKVGSNANMVLKLR